MSQQQQKPINCNACGARIKFDNAVRSQTGKMIPIDFFSGQKHDCPARKQQQQNQNVPGEPRETTIAAQKTAAEYPDRSAAIERMHKEKMDADKELTNAILALAGEMNGIKEYLQVIAKGGATFKPASAEWEIQKAIEVEVAKQLAAAVRQGEQEE